MTSCPSRKSHLACLAVGGVYLLMLAMAQTSIAAERIDFTAEPINYLAVKSSDRVAKLIKQIEGDVASLEYDPTHGYLRSLLKALDVPTASQVLVFSKTSLQIRYISPSSPRAIFFNDDVYVAWCQGGEIIEISAVDPTNGPFFYSLAQRRTKRPQIKREAYDCLQCHATSLTGGIPGHTVRSVYTSGSGRLERSSKNSLTDHTSPFEQRWGGWYVSGEHGLQRHLGNLPRRAGSHLRENDSGANVTNLGRFFNTLAYPTRHSDIVALMVLEHQTKLHNLITQANYLTRIAQHSLTAGDEKNGPPDQESSVVFKQQVAAAGEPLVKYILMSGEAKLTAPVAGTTRFAKDFTSRGPHDNQGRSLRDLDLTRRMFKYSCSYLIYSSAFDQLPDAVRSYTYRRILDVLTEQDNGDDWKHLSSEDRRAILEILCATKKGLPPSYAAALAKK